MKRKTKVLIAAIILALIFSAVVSFVLGTAVIAHAETGISSDATYPYGQMDFQP